MKENIDGLIEIKRTQLIDVISYYFSTTEVMAAVSVILYKSGQE